MSDPPILEEVKASASKLNIGKLVGKDGIIIEMLRFGDDHLVDIIDRIILNIWNTVCVSND